MICHLAAGFGSSSSSSSGSLKKKKSNKKKKKKKTLSSLVETQNQNQQQEEEDKVVLDRFGLPVATIDDIFPPMPSDTELVSCNDEQEYSLQDIQTYMSQHIQLNWDIFDSHGVQKHTHHDNHHPWKLKLLHASPPVLAIENFFSQEECLEYRNMASNDDDDDALMMKVKSATFSPLAQSKRTSTTWYCHFQKVPTLLAKAQYLLNDINILQMEEPQIVRYQTGQQFSWHYDEIPSNQLHNGGQRVATLLVYLNTLNDDNDDDSVNAGGGTIFRDLLQSSSSDQPLTMKPKEGSALLFFPSFADGKPDDRTLHKGEVVLTQKHSKMIAQMWIHQRQYNPVLPEGNSHEKAIPVIRSKREELGYPTTTSITTDTE